MVEIRQPAAGDVDYLAVRLRAADIAECQAAGWAPGPALQHSVECSNDVWTATVGGRPAAMFGCTPQGVIWMLGSDEIARNRRALASLAPQYIRKMLADRPVLFNRVHAKNTLAVAWLKRVGFKLHEAIPIEPHGEMFHPFEMTHE